MAVRADVAVPSVIAFLFGAACGLVTGWLVGSGGQTEAGAPAAAAAPVEGGGGSGAPSAAQQEREMREALRMHEELLAASPDNARLVRTVAEYHAALGGHEKALAMYAQAEELIRRDGLPDEELVEVLFDRGLSLAELSRVREAIDSLEAAVELDPRSVKARLVQVFIYLRRVMPAPPPGFDRRDSVLRAEQLVNEVLAIDPSNADALGFKRTIDSVRASLPPPAAGSDATP
jgi:tetratricopeptide (TPR) repeat protein